MIFNSKRKLPLLIVLLAVLVIECDDNENQKPELLLQLASAKVGPYNLNLNEQTKNTNAPLDEPIVVTFNAPLDLAILPNTVFG